LALADAGWWCSPDTRLSILHDRLLSSLETALWLGRVQDARHGPLAGKPSLGLWLSTNPQHSAGGETSTRPKRRLVRLSIVHHGCSRSLDSPFFITPPTSQLGSTPPSKPATCCLAHASPRHGYSHHHAPSKLPGRRLLVWRHRCSFCTRHHHRSRCMCAGSKSGHFRVCIQAPISQAFY